MSFFLTALKTELLSIFRDRKSMALLLLLPIAIVLLSAAVPKTELLPAVPVGWAMEDDCQYGSKLLNLIRQEDGFLEFIPASEDTLRANVASGKWACGFVLRDDFDFRVEKSRWDSLFTLVRGENAALPSMVSEAVSSAMLVMVSESIGRDYLEEQGMLPPDEGWILEEALRLDIIPVYEEVPGFEAVSWGFGQNLIRGAAGILILVLAVSMGDALSRRRKSPEFMRVAAVRGEAILLLSAVVCRSVLIFVVAFLSTGLSNAIPLAALCLCMAALMALLSFLPNGYSAALLPFCVPVLLVLCPVFFDAASFMPQLKPLSDAIPVTHFIRGEAMPGLIWAAALFAAAAILNKIKK